MTKTLLALAVAWVLNALALAAPADAVGWYGAAPVASSAVCSYGTLPGQLTPCLSGLSTSLGGSALAAGACSSTTLTITGAAATMVAVASPTTYPGDGGFWFAYVSAANTVTIKVCAVVAGTPTATTYQVRIFG